MSPTDDRGGLTSAHLESPGIGFLDDLPARPVTLPSRSPFRPVGLHLGQGASALEVLIATTEGAPAATALRSAWKARKGGRAAPVLLVVLYDDKAAPCGPAGEDAPAHVGLDPEQVGVPCGPLDPDDKQDKIHEIDAVVAHLYGLKEKHLRHIFETFHEGWGHEDRLCATMKHFRTWKRTVRA